MAQQLFPIAETIWVDPDEIACVQWSPGYGLQVRFKHTAGWITVGWITDKRATWTEILSAISKFVGALGAARTQEPDRA